MNFIYKKILKLRERYIDTLAKLYEYSTAIYADNKLSVMLDSDMGYTYSSFKHKCDEISARLSRYGISSGDRVAILSQNMPNWTVAMFSLVPFGRISVPILPDSSETEITNILNHSESKAIFVSKKLLPKVSKECIDKLTLVIDIEDFTLIKRDEAAFMCNGRVSSPLPDDLATIIYTSGTTGNAKGVMLSHSNYIAAFRAHDIIFTSLTDQDVSMNFLPLTHIFEKAWTFFCLHRGIQVCINLHPQDIQMTIKEIRPTAMCSVPRFWEKVYAGVQERIEQESGLRRRLIEDAIRVGRAHNIDYVRVGKTPPIGLHLKYLFYEKTVYHLLKKTIGIENGTFFPTAGATVSDEICTFAHSVGINLLVGYGLTESTATVSCFGLTHYEIGSVGTIIPGLEVKIGENSEILLRGKTITAGYYKRPEANAAAFDAEGWFHTGDAGYLKGNDLYLTERLKDLFKTSNGKYISPQALETKLAIDRYIDQIAIIADQRKFVSALIVPVYPLVEAYAKEKGLEWHSREELLAHPKVEALFRARIDTLQQPFAHYEQVKRFTLLPAPFSMERGELTNTLKLRRAVVAEHYKDLIEKMYEE